MSRFSKPVTFAHLNDATLGLFKIFPPSETLDHLIRYLSTWSGSDKLFMIIDYALKVTIPLLNMRARLQHHVGLREDVLSHSAKSMAKFGSLVSDSRMLWRIWGILPILQWLISMERNPPPTRRLLTIERLQGWSMIAYYTFEHLYYLRVHDLIPTHIPSLGSYLSHMRTKPIFLDTGALGIWSCRCWAIYVFLQLAHLGEDRQLLKSREKNLKKGKALDVEEKGDLDKRWDAFWNEVVVNLGNLPLTLHWSLSQGLFKDEIWVGVFGLIAGVASFRSGWQATALPRTKTELPVEGLEVAPLTTGTDDESSRSF